MQSQIFTGHMYAILLLDKKSGTDIAINDTINCT